jgi:hydrogenase-4 membrane subunit HyfE
MIGVAGAAALLLSIGLLCARRIDTALRICALQALFAAATLGAAGVAIALLAVALNGVVLPVAIARMNSAAPLAVRGSAFVSWAGATVLLVAAVTGLAKVGTDETVAVGVSVTLLGLLVIVARSHTLAPALGLLSSQNGVVLVAGAHPDVSLPAALAVAIPLIPALALADHWLRR